MAHLASRLDRRALGALGAVLAATIHGPSGGVRNAAIVWSSDDAIRSANLDGSRRRVLFPMYGDDQGDPSWTRDGRALAFFVRYSDTVSIYVLWPGTRRLRVLGSGNSRSFEPTWSPDAKRIAVSEDWGGFGLSRPEATIRVVSLATKKSRPVTTPRRHWRDIAPAWSPDGRMIAFARQHNGETPTLYLVRPDGSASRRLTEGGSPSWSPDGKSIAFVVGGSVYRIGADGRSRKLILSGLLNPLVRWSPDGRKLLYTSGRYTNADAWIADVDGTHRRRILHHQAIEGIAWRPGSG